MSSVQVAMAEELKDEFILKLAGRNGYRSEINKLAKEKRLLEIKISELVSQAYVDMEDGIHEETPRGWQSAFIFDTDCKKSPYGLHAVSNYHQFNHFCMWCDESVEDYEREVYCDGDPAWHPKT